MSNDPVPIKEGVLPRFDIERELLDFCQAQIKDFIETAGQPPTRIAVAVMGKGTDDKFHTTTNSWDTREEICRMENCSLASTLFLRRALGDD